MNATIRSVWSASFIAESVRRFPSEYSSPAMRAWEQGEIVKEKLREAISALTAWAQAKNITGGPDGNDLAGFIRDVCTDTDMHVIAERDYKAIADDAKVLANGIREMEKLILTKQEELIPERLADRRRFTPGYANALDEHATD